MQIRFSLATKYGTYSDALNLPDDHTFSDAEIEAMKIQRRDNWVAHIDSTQTAQVEDAVENTEEIPAENTEETPVETPTE